ncbi:hypothetical protein O6H91_09G014200 [Diphasiastrum complanatum]|uniref:Uncharacterized protein n=1 Tax=Diphasiastrum complanatum TaxID=34168 RepID=A0ACC2CLF4_DIPCM|nr:hypothetical protein O6H91_09G014200 [Diphasiastrum complanatum]
MSEPSSTGVLQDDEFSSNNSSNGPEDYGEGSGVEAPILHRRSTTPDSGMDESQPAELYSRKSILSLGGLPDALVDSLKSRSIKEDNPRSSQIYSNSSQSPMVGFFSDLGGKPSEAAESSQRLVPPRLSADFVLNRIKIKPFEAFGSISNPSFSVKSPRSAGAVSLKESITSMAESSSSMPLLEFQDDPDPDLPPVTSKSAIMGSPSAQPTSSSGMASSKQATHTSPKSWKSLKRVHSDLVERSLSGLAFRRFRNSIGGDLSSNFRPSTAPGSLASGGRPSELLENSTGFNESISSRIGSSGVAGKAPFRARISSTTAGETRPSKLDAQRSVLANPNMHRGSSSRVSRQMEHKVRAC